jgi:hypothetical protein
MRSRAPLVNPFEHVPKLGRIGINTIKIRTGPRGASGRACSEIWTAGFGKETHQNLFRAFDWATPA